VTKLIERLLEQPSTSTPLCQGCCRIARAEACA
jgi:hypothetical protein